MFSAQEIVPNEHQANQAETETGARTLANQARSKTLLAAEYLVGYTAKNERFQKLSPEEIAEAILEGLTRHGLTAEELANQIKQLRGG